MPIAARKLLGLRTHSLGQSEWSADTFYSTGDVVAFGGHQWRATDPTARGHAPQGVGDGSTDDRQLLLDACSEGWGAGTTGGGLSAPTYVVTTAADHKTAPTPGMFRYAAGLGNQWITFDPDVFDPDDPTAINLLGTVELGPNTTIDGRGAGVQFRKYQLSYRSDRSAPIVANRGQHTANLLIAYVDFVDFPNGTSVLEVGGNNPFRRGGADLVYIHHITVRDIEDQNMSNAHHDNNLSRSTMDWSRFGPSPGPIMMSLTTLGGMKLFQVDANDVTNNTITTLDALGNPTNHNLVSLASGARANFVINSFRRADQSAHPYPAGVTSGAAYTVRHVGQASATAKTFTASSTTNTLTATAHGYSNGDPVVLNLGVGATIPGGLRNGYIYYVRDVTANTFKLATKVGEAAKGLTSNGSGTLQVQKADLTKFQLSVAGGQTGWTALDITGTGSGWYLEETEPVYFQNGKGPQWGSHHGDDVPDGMVTFTADPATDTVTTLYPHRVSDGQEIRFWAQDGGMPGGITEGVTYYTRDTTSTTFKVAATAGGAAINLTSTAAPQQAVTFDAATDYVTAAAHGLAAGDMVAFTGGSLPSALEAGIVYWVADPDASATPPVVLTTNTFQVAARKHDPPLALDNASGTVLKRPPLVQLLIGPNRASITKCDFRNMKIRSPKLQIGWYHLWNNRVYKWGDPDRADTVGGFGNEMADGAQALIENSIYRPYAANETHYWSAFTNPAETIPTVGRSIYGINVDSGSMGPVDTDDWTGGAAAILNGNLYEDGATTRNATSGATVIVNASQLDWYDGATKPVPYDYTPIAVTTDPFILDTILDRGAGNVQPWELVS